MSWIRLETITFAITGMMIVLAKIKHTHDSSAGPFRKKILLAMLMPSAINARPPKVLESISNGISLFDVRAHVSWRHQGFRISQQSAPKTKE